MRNQRTHIFSRLVLTGLALLVMLLLSAPSAPASGGCPNEAVRAESNINPATHEPYDVGLPECRAYEMVTPLEKQGHNALAKGGINNIFASPEGESIEWIGQGDYAGAENYEVHSFEPTNSYLARRTSAGWATSSAYPPASLIAENDAAYEGTGVYSPNLGIETTCGATQMEGNVLRCVWREQYGAPWSQLPDEYMGIGGAEVSGAVEGASENGEVYVFKMEAEHHLLPGDTTTTTVNCIGNGTCGGIYEVRGIKTASPELKLVNVNDAGEMIGPGYADRIGSLVVQPYGGAYQAVSANGEKIFFTAEPEGGAPTVYARIDGQETVAVSNPAPAECTTCNATPAEGRFQGASANGERVFFTTPQQLLNGDTDTTNDLYEYDFGKPAGHNLTQVSAGGLGDATPGSGAEVQGVVAVSENGSHVYYVADGVLTSLPNALGQTAQPSADNLYAYDSETGETKFVAVLAAQDGQLWGETEISGDGVSGIVTARATPDGEYLVFDSFAEILTTGVEADTSDMQQVYRYDFSNGQIVRVSVGHEGYAANGNVVGHDARIAGLAERNHAQPPTINDESRTISESGQTIAFVTAAALQNTDVASGQGSATSCGSGVQNPTGAGCEVYVWHECTDGKCEDGNAGEVNLISEGVNAEGITYAGMSATGANIFFETTQQLVGQDTDHLGDIYDARIDGGFPAPTAEPSCSGEACQGTPSGAPSNGTPASITTAPGGNLVAPPFKEVLEPETKPKSKPLTRAQKLAAALKACKRDVRHAKKARCEKQARAKYGPVRKKATH